jgi:gas vesicle protein
LQDAYDDTTNERQGLETRLERFKELYGWGDLTKDQHLAWREVIQNKLKALSPVEDKSNNLAKLVHFLANVANVADAWEEANQEHRNKLARCLFQKVWLKDNVVVAVKPQTEFEPFFKLHYESFEELSHLFGKWRPRWDSNPRSPP